jgi:hypothetical protein
VGDWLKPPVLKTGVHFVDREFESRPLRQSDGASILHGVVQIGKSKAKVYIEKKTGVTFADAEGIDESEEELVEVVEFLKIWPISSMRQRCWRRAREKRPLRRVISMRP